MMARFKCCLDPLTPHQIKNVVRVGPPLANLLEPRMKVDRRGQKVNHCAFDLASDKMVCRNHNGYYLT